MTRVKWKLVSIRLEVVLTLTQDRCTVCGERTTGSEIDLEAPNGILGDEGQAEARFGPFGDSVSVGAR